MYQTFEHNQVVFRKSGTSMIAAPPGRFKTGLALNLAAKWADEGLVVIYVAADSDPATIGKRCAGILTGKDITEDIEPNIKSGMFRHELERLNNIHWEFRSLDVAAIEKRLQASEQMYGQPADVVFVDNLMNCVPGGPGDWSGQIQMCRDLNDLAVAMGPTSASCTTASCRRASTSSSPWASVRSRGRSRSSRAWCSR